MSGRSELTVITKSKDLCSYVMTVTQKSPKHYRYTFVSRLQNLSLNIIENLYRANEIFITRNDTKALDTRLGFQQAAMTDLKILAYFSLLAMEQKCILPRQYEQIARQSAECMSLLNAWIGSDRRRMRG